MSLSSISTKEMTLTLKRLARGWGSIRPSSCGFSKNLSSKEMVKPWFFVFRNIIIGHIFPENVTEIPQVVQNI